MDSMGRSENNGGPVKNVNMQVTLPVSTTIDLTNSSFAEIFLLKRVDILFQVWSLINEKSKVLNVMCNFVNY